MSSIVLPKGRSKGMGVVMLAFAALLAGCNTSPDHISSSSAVNLDAEIARASKLRQPVLILVTESGLGLADDRARALFHTLTVNNSSILSVLLDLSISRNRAVAARYHVTNTPVLLSLSPRGLIVARDGNPITKKLIHHRIADVVQRGPDLDAKLASLEDAAAKNRNDSTAQLELADFLLAQQNAREAIPTLVAVAHSESTDATQRVRAWVELVRAHFWIAEPEKGRHEAEDLITVLGPTTAEARAAGNFLLGLQDANAKRTELARTEFQAAIDAAPQSAYAKQAAETLVNLPGAAK
jgi:tetratricopeptide (TPR) repeat protein